MAKTSLGRMQGPAEKLKTWFFSEFILDRVLKSRVAKCKTFKKDKSGSVEKVIEKKRGLFDFKI